MPQSENRATLPLPENCPSFAAGQQIGPYQVGRVYKRGSQAVLFRLNGERLLRVYYAGEAPDRALRSALKEHPAAGVCPIREMGQADGHEYDVIPRLQPLPDLRELPEEEKKEWIRRQVEAVRAFHGMGYLHLDLKPEHFMRNRRGRVFLIDPGSARKKGEGGPAPKTTPGFAPPEREAGIYEESYDWYSFGICLADELGGGVYPDLDPEEIPAVPEGSLPPTREPLPGPYRRMVRELVRADRERRYRGEEILRVLSGENIPVEGGRIIHLERRPNRTEEPGPDRTGDRTVDRQPAERPARTESVSQLQSRLARSIVTLAKHADALVYARHLSGMQIRWDDAASLRRALEQLSLMPREERVVNETNISLPEAQKVPGAFIRTDFSGPDFRFRTYRGRLKTLREGPDFYVVSKEWLNQEEQHHETILRARRRQAGSAAKAVGLAGAVSFGIFILIKILPYLIIIAIVFAILGAL